MSGHQPEQSAAAQLHDGVQALLRGTLFDGEGVMVRACIVAEWMSPDGRTLLATWHSDSTMSWHARGMHAEAIRMLDEDECGCGDDDDEQAGEP